MIHTLENGKTVTGEALAVGQLRAKLQVHLSEKYQLSDEAAFAVLIDKDEAKQKFFKKDQKWVDDLIGNVQLPTHFEV